MFTRSLLAEHETGEETEAARRGHRPGGGGGGGLSEPQETKEENLQRRELQKGTH